MFCFKSNKNYDLIAAVRLFDSNRHCAISIVYEVNHVYYLFIFICDSSAIHPRISLVVALLSINQAYINYQLHTYYDYVYVCLMLLFHFMNHVYMYLLLTAIKFTNINSQHQTCGCFKIKTINK